MTRRRINMAGAIREWFIASSSERSFEILERDTAKADGDLQSALDKYFLAEMLDVPIARIVRPHNEVFGLFTTDLNAKALNRLMNAEIVIDDISYVFQKLDAELVQTWESYVGYDMDACHPTNTPYVAVTYKKVE